MWVCERLTGMARGGVEGISGGTEAPPPLRMRRWLEIPQAARGQARSMNGWARSQSLWCHLY